MVGPHEEHLDPRSGHPRTEDAWYRMQLDSVGSKPGNCPASGSKVIQVDTRILPDHGTIFTPPFMEYVVRTIGSGRVVAAAVAGAVTRPLGVRGTFYRLAGSVARDIDGGRPPYEHLLFPPLETSTAQQICADLERALGIGVGIVDLNDFDGSIRAVSDTSLPPATLAAVPSA